MRKKSAQLGITGEKLFTKDSINFIYDGPSFNGKMELPKLTSQLRSTEILITEMINDLYQQKNLKSPEKTKIYLELKRGSFQEIISIVFNHPLTIAIIGGSVVALFDKFINLKSTLVSPIDLTNISNSFNIINNLNLIVSPLQSNKDKLIIELPDSKQSIAIHMKDKKKIKDKINQIKEDTKTIEVFEEEFFGILDTVRISKGKYAFSLEETDKLIPVEFEKTPSLDEIKKILGQRVKITARATFENKILKKLKILKYELKRRKNLKDYF
jgi:hypothetical protein